MISLPIISIVCCLAYILYILFRYGVPVSISESYYILPSKWDWLFSAWCVLTSTPLGIYWYTVAPTGMKWIPIVCMIAMLFISVSCRYKSDCKCSSCVSGNQEDSLTVENAGSIKSFFKKLSKKFSPKELFKYGWTKVIHYINSLILIILSTTYICIMDHKAIINTILLYILGISIGLKVDGVYNPHYSADVDNKSWIFFLEIICITTIFTFII